MSLFLSDTIVHQLSEHQWRAEIKEGWRIGQVPNGGYVLSIAGQVLSEAMPGKAPLSVNGFFLAPTTLGEARCEVEILRNTGRTGFAQLRMYQKNELEEDELKLLVTAAYSDFDTRKGDSWTIVESPDYGAWEDHKAIEQPAQIETGQRVEVRLVQGRELFDRTELRHDGTVGGWIHHKDGSAVSPVALLMFADIMPPPIFTHFGFQKWVPTVELTVQVRGEPCPGPLKVRFITRHLTDGVMEEDGEIWDSNDQLVAISRQSAILRVVKR